MHICLFYASQNRPKSAFSGHRCHLTLPQRGFTKPVIRQMVQSI